MSDNLDNLVAVLDEADHAHAVDIFNLDGLNSDELAYLDSLGELPDPDSDGLECDR